LSSTARENGIKIGKAPQGGKKSIYSGSSNHQRQWWKTLTMFFNYSPFYGFRRICSLIIEDFKEYLCL
jgi:hypothetical protein